MSKFLAELFTQGIYARAEVQTKYGIADVVTEDTVYEVKRVLDMQHITLGLGQLQLFAFDLGVKPVLAGPWHPDADRARPALERLGIQIRFLTSEPVRTKQPSPNQQILIG